MGHHRGPASALTVVSSQGTRGGLHTERSNTKNGGTFFKSRSIFYMLTKWNMKCRIAGTNCNHLQKEDRGALSGQA
jgi:hypothetical protein